MTKMDFDDFTNDYNRILEQQLNFFDKDNLYFAEYKIKKTQALCQQTPQTILDFGCGIGRSLPFFQKYFPSAQLFGCDTSAKSLKLARQRHSNVTFHFTDQLIQANLRFDLIFLSGVLHHVEPIERLAVMNWLSSLLNLGGELIIFEHNPLNPVTRYLVKTCPFDRGVTLLPAGETTNLVKKVGLQKIACDYTLFFPASFKKLRPLETYLRKLPLGGQYVVRATAI